MCIHFVFLVMDIFNSFVVIGFVHFLLCSGVSRLKLLL